MGWLGWIPYLNVHSVGSASGVHDDGDVTTSWAVNIPYLPDPSGSFQTHHEWQDPGDLGVSFDSPVITTGGGHGTMDIYVELWNDACGVGVSW